MNWTPFHFQRYPRACRKGGFSLVEVVLALGIVSFSLVGILSLFPVALDTAKDSKNETRVTLIAQTILSDLKSSPPDKAEVVIYATEDPAQRQVTSSPLSGFAPVYVAYDSQGLAIKSISDSEFNQRSNIGAFVASIQATTNGVPVTGLALVTVSIQTPPQADGISRSARKKYNFATYLPIE